MIRNLFAFIFLTSIASAVPLGNPGGREGPQATTGTVQGQVTDPTGAAVSGASVTILNSITNYKVTALTDDGGAFRFQNVPFNSYKLTVTAAEFQQSEQSIDLHSARPQSSHWVIVSDVTAVLISRSPSLCTQRCSVRCRATVPA